MTLSNASALMYEVSKRSASILTAASILVEIGLHFEIFTFWSCYVSFYRFLRTLNTIPRSEILFEGSLMTYHRPLIWPRNPISASMASNLKIGN